MLTREQAIEIARRCAKAKPQSYYSEPFQPHEWVIDAIVAGYSMCALDELAKISQEMGLYDPPKSNDEGMEHAP